MLIIVTYDENGGYWDHVPPPVRDRWGPGTRIPLIAIGPTVKRGFPRQARLRRSHGLRFRFDPEDDRGAVRPGAADRRRR